MTHGKCSKCKVVFQWQGRPLLKDAACPRCKDMLDRTAASLVKRMPIVAEHPLWVNGAGVYVPHR